MARGERPTVERVRTELGRGSPARVGQLLEAWWDALAKRLAGETRLPALPSAASAAFTELWRIAMEEARAVAQREIEEQRAAIEVERAQLREEMAGWERHVANSDRARLEADTARNQVAERLEDMQRLTMTLEQQAADAADRQKALELQLQTAERERRETLERLAAREAAATQEREAAAQHLRIVEDRSHAEVDRARQEVKVFRTDFERADRAHQQAMREVQQREADLRLRLSQEERSVGEHAARVKALEEQLARLDGLGDALRSAQEGIRAGLDREAQLRHALDEETRRGTYRIGASASDTPSKRTSRKLKKP